jgi:hypothetical protein
MGKIQVDHRIVVWDGNDRIVSDHPERDFKAACPVYEAAVANLKAGQSVTMQHGARVIRRSTFAS